MTSAPAPVGAETAAARPALRVTKGHGTQNDFVLIDDREALLDLGPGLVRGLADRRAGVGADGVIRLVPSAALPEGRELLDGSPGADWFMDYRNADGSVAEMCGNGVRVLAALLERLGSWVPADGALELGTRAGVRTVRAVDDPLGGAAAWYSVDMGPWAMPGGAAAVAAGFDAEVAVHGLRETRRALSVDVGNPHTVLALVDVGELEALDLTRAPVVDPVPPQGTNVEIVVPLGEEVLADGTVVGRVRMRVHERGVGETRSCGTGACAAALAVRAWAGAGAPDTWFVEVPGGTVRVRALADGHVELAGPAVLVAEAQVDVAALIG